MSVMQMLSRVGVKTVRFDVGRGGKQDLTPEDLIMHIGMAEAAGRLSEIAAMFALAYYTNTYSDNTKDLIIRFLCARLFIKAKKEGMRVKSNTIKQIVNLSISNSIDSPVCPKCNGQRRVLVVLTEFNMRRAQFNHQSNHSELQDCKACNGTGYKQLSNYKKAINCDMSGGKSWTTNHEMLLAFSQQIIMDWNKEIKQALSSIHNFQ
ncbi:hypothetical protein [Catenovulum sediminis]